MKLNACFLVALAALACAPVAHADQGNLDRAMQQAAGDFKTGGEKAMTTRAKFCYDSVDYGRGNRAQTAGAGVEYCFAYEAAAVSILNERGGYKNAGYFNGQDVMVRAVRYLEKARVIALPEEFNPYWVPRVDYIKEAIPGVLQKAGA